MSLLFLQRDGLGQQVWAALPPSAPTPHLITISDIDFTKNNPVEHRFDGRLFVADAFVICDSVDEFVSGPSLRVINESGEHMTGGIPVSTALASPNHCIAIHRPMPSSIISFAGATGKLSIQILAPSLAKKHVGSVALFVFFV